MKILFLTPWYPHAQNPNSGIFIRDQAELASENHEVAVIFSMVDYDKFAVASSSVTKSVHKNITEFRVVVKRSLFLFNQLNYLWLTFRQIRKVVKEFQPDIIQANVSYPSAVFALMLSKLLGKPYFVVEHTRITNHFRTGFHKRATVMALQKAAALFAVSRNLANEMKAVAHRDVNVLPNVIDIDRFKVSPYQPGTPHIGFLGALNTPVKGLDVLLKAVSGIASDFVLHIGGQGSLLDEYRELATKLGVESKCRFYGFFPHADIPSFMSKLHFFVSSSRYETFGIVIIEAMASGLPVVVTKSGGPDDYIDQESGIVVPVEDEIALRAAIEKMMMTYQSYDRSSIAQKVNVKFSRKVISEELNRIYSSIS